MHRYMYTADSEFRVCGGSEQSGDFGLRLHVTVSVPTWMLGLLT